MTGNEHALDGQITELERQLSALYRKRDASRAGKRSGQSRIRPERDAEIARRYPAARREKYGVKDLAAAFGLTVRRVNQIFREQANENPSLRAQLPGYRAPEPPPIDPARIAVDQTLRRVIAVLVHASGSGGPASGLDGKECLWLCRQLAGALTTLSEMWK